MASPGIRVRIAVALRRIFHLLEGAQRQESYKDREER